MDRGRDEVQESEGSQSAIPLTMPIQVARGFHASIVLSYHAIYPTVPTLWTRIADTLSLFCIDRAILRFERSMPR